MKKALLYLLAIVLIAIMILLGFWQLSRASEKQAIQDHYLRQSQQQVELNQQFVKEENLYQLASGKGNYLVDKYIFIDNQSFQGRAGYHVLVPFRFVGNDQIVMINLGWVPMGASRELKPKIALPEELITIQGRIQKPHSKPLVWDSTIPLIQQQAWQYLDMAKVKEVLNLNQLAPMVLELEPKLKGVGGFARKWHVYDDHWVNRHKAYAMQWFSLAGALLILCLVVEFRARRKES